MDRFKQSGDIEDLDGAIVILQQAVDNISTTEAQHPEQTLFSDLARAIGARYNKLRQPQDLAKAIDFHHTVYPLFTVSDPRHFSWLSSMVSISTILFQRTRAVGHLDTAIDAINEFLLLCPPPQYVRDALHDLGDCLFMRFETQMQRKDLDDSIKNFRESLSLHVVGEPGSFMTKNSLSTSLATQFSYYGDIAALDEAIELQRDAVSTATGDQRPVILHNLASTLSKKWRFSGDVRYLDETIHTYQEAMRNQVPGPAYAYTLSGYALSLCKKFDVTRDVQLLEDAIRHLQTALRFTPEGSTRSEVLRNLADAHQAKYMTFGNTQALDEAIRLRYGALHTETTRFGRAGRLHQLSNSLRYRYEALSIEDDILQAIKLDTQGLDLLPEDHPHRWKSLSSVAKAFLFHKDAPKAIDKHGKQAWATRNHLDIAEELFRQALECQPLTDPNSRASLLHDLAIALTCRFHEQETISDLEGCIELEKNALQLNSHVLVRCSSLYSLTMSYTERFKRTGNIGDRECAIRYGQEGASLLPPEHPYHCHFYRNLAVISDDPFQLYEKAATHKTTSARGRYQAAIEWAELARSEAHPTTIQAYSHALSLLDRCVTSFPTAELQHLVLVNMTKTMTLASDACSAAIEAKQFDIAVELLDQGRCLMWTRLTRYRDSLKELQLTNGTLAAEFQVASRELENLALSATGSTTLSLFPEAEGQKNSPNSESFDRRGLDNQLHSLHQASEKWDNVVERIRQIEGFRNFLRAVPFVELQIAAQDGPIVVVNVSKYRSDALIVQHNCDVAHVELPGVTPEKLASLSSSLESNLDLLQGTSAATKSTSSLQDPLSTLEANRYRARIKKVLRTLWESIVKPIVDKLLQIGIVYGSRVWWYPTGVLCRLPLHAAGLYKPSQTIFPELYVSSYMTSFTRALHSRIETSAPAPDILVIGVPGEQETHLPNVAAEIAAIMRISSMEGSMASLRVLIDESAQTQDVQTYMADYSWVHFICHGIQSPRPLESSFKLQDQHLKLIDLVHSYLPRAELAFLSACNTATGDIEGTPDEFIHLAAAMQFCGFRSVIGTLWPMRDQDGPVVAQDFYKHLLGAEGSADVRNSARALHAAVKGLRENDVPIECWINFVHFGI
ncbi:hypothetical protein EIP86_000506 [Pleurotus ostreatoroseus]|nr:hypothetical protein EIP86_000506 [Pleurotus ostreatoroseus]